MLSRRYFLLGALTFISSSPETWARKLRAPIRTGPRSLSRQEWPPVVSPDYISIVDRGLALLGDQSGRLAIVDLKREDGPQVVGELSGIGRKVVDLQVLLPRAYALAYKDAGSDAEAQLVVMNLAPSSDPRIVQSMKLAYFAEPTSITAAAEAICVGGVGTDGQNMVHIFSGPGRKKTDESLQPLASISFEHPVTHIDLQDKVLIVLESGATTQVSFIRLLDPRAPEKMGTVKLDGRYDVLARTRDNCLVAGQASDRKHQVQLISWKTNKPVVVSNAVIPLTEIMDAAGQRGQYLLVGNQGKRQAVLPVSVARNQSLSVGSSVFLPGATGGAAAKARIALKEGNAYVASDWGGVQVLNIQRNGWQYLYSHTIPRLPAAAIAVSGNRAVLAGSDLKLYDITNPESPQLLESTEVGGTVKGVEPAGNNILCLAKETLTLRRAERPAETLAVAKLSANSIAYDRGADVAYALAMKENATQITPYKINGNLTPSNTIELPSVYRRASGMNGKLLLSGLNNLTLFDVAARQELGSRTFSNLALRDLYLTPEMAVVTAVDKNSRGFILVLATNRADLPTLGSIDLPQDAVAVDVSGKTAVVVGRNHEGKDFATLVDLSNPVMPRITQSFPVVEAASAVVIKDQLALIAGRGLEILSLG